MSAGTGHYGGASMAIPMALLLLYPPFLIFVIVAGLVIVAVVAIRTLVD